MSARIRHLAVVVAIVLTVGACTGTGRSTDQSTPVRPAPERPS